MEKLLININLISESLHTLAQSSRESANDNLASKANIGGVLLLKLLQLLLLPQLPLLLHLQLVLSLLLLPMLLVLEFMLLNNLSLLRSKLQGLAVSATGLFHGRSILASERPKNGGVGSSALEPLLIIMGV